MRLPKQVRPERGDHAKRWAKLHNLKALLRRRALHTVCESARCPNIGECFERGTATFMILGNTCTRSCSFCAVGKGAPAPVDPAEPKRIALVAKELRLKHVVVTSVTRDDLEDGGASQFAKVIGEIRTTIPRATIEVLIPDFKGETGPLETVLKAEPDILNHNLETVPRLYKEVRPQADFARSLDVIRRASHLGASTKSGLMLGMGETRDEVIAVLEDLQDVSCDMLTLGQYLQPTRAHRPVTRYLEPSEFDNYRDIGLHMGFKLVASAPLVRSSYRAGEGI